MPLFYLSTDAVSHLSSTSLKQEIICFLKGWLDDIGLPQYKSHFDEGRVDGRMLHYMTVVSDASSQLFPLLFYESEINSYP